MLRLWLVFGALIATTAHSQDVPIPAVPQFAAKSYYLLDFSSGKILAEHNANEPLEPASLTKLMTAYVVFKALRNGSVHLEDRVPVSEKAWRTQGSRTFIEVDTEVVLEDLVRGMIIQSGNDASVALAEHVAGSEEAFVDLMNQYARILGMTNTVYRNSTGLPAADHLSTAHDAAMLARAIIAEFPDLYAIYSEREFTYNDITQHNRNALLWRDESVDGLKTGYTSEAGYCLVSSAERAEMRLIAVVMGMGSAKARADGSQALLNYGFRFFETHKLYSRGEQLAEARVWKGEAETVALGLEQDLYVTVPRGQYDALTATVELEPQLVAPIGESAPVGEIEVSYNEDSISVLPLVALHAVPEAGLLTRIADGLLLWFD